MKKILEIKTVTVEIKVVRVDGHKMTKATFRQLQFIDPYRQNSKTTKELIINRVLGWVFDDGTWLLCEINGALGKYEFKRGDGKYINGAFQRPNEEHYLWIKDYFDQLFIAT